ncbi:MAG: hypothetical protein M3394_06460 [Actinomycetota bacterium]|nr:hypothetical protein [Actinomycetota bacterium]
MALSLFAALSSGPARAASTGVGTGTAQTTVFGVELGTDGALLGVKLLGDSARSTIDPKTATAAEAFSKFTGVDVTSSVAALNKTAPAVESRQPGGEPEVTRGSVNLTHPSTDPDVTIPSSVLTGTIGFAKLASEATPASAQSSLSATLTNATVAGAVARVKGVTSDLTTSASSTASEATRSVKVDQVVVLDLSALLAGLDLDLHLLPLPIVMDLLAALQETVTGLPDAAAVEDKVTALNDAIDAVQAQLTTLNAATGSLPSPVGTLVGTVNGTPLGVLIDPATQTTLTGIVDPAAQLAAVIAELNAVVDDLQNELTKLLTDVLAVLDGAPLLTVDGAEASVVTKAADTVANSVATTTAKVGSVSVGARAIPGVDIKEAIATVEAKEKEVDAAVATVTSKLHPDLANLVTFDLFAPAAGAGKSSAGGYVKAVEGVTVLTAKVTPPAALATLVTTIKGSAPSIGQEIDNANGPDPVPQVASEITALENALGTGTQAMAGGGTFKVAQVLGTSEYAVGASGFPGSGINSGPGSGNGGGTPGEADRTLPATGANSTVPMAAFALLLVALGLGFRQWMHMPLQPIRIRIPTRTR